MKVQLTISGFKTKYGFESSFYKGDLNNGRQLKEYLKKFYKFSEKQQKQLIFNHFTIENI